MGVPVRRNMCVSIPTIGCLDITARPEPKAPLTSDSLYARQEKLAIGVLLRTDMAHVPPVLRLDPNFLERHNIVRRRRKAICNRSKTFRALFRKKSKAPGISDRLRTSNSGTRPSAPTCRARWSVWRKVQDARNAGGCRRPIVACESWTLPCCSKTTLGCKHYGRLITVGRVGALAGAPPSCSSSRCERWRRCGWPWPIATKVRGSGSCSVQLLGARPPPSWTTDV